MVNGKKPDLERFTIFHFPSTISGKFANYIAPPLRGVNRMHHQL